MPYLGSSYVAESGVRWSRAESGLAWAIAYLRARCLRCAGTVVICAVAVGFQILQLQDLASPTSNLLAADSSSAAWHTSYICLLMGFVELDLYLKNSLHARETFSDAGGVQ